MHERFLLESYHVMDEVEKIDEASRGQIGLGGQVEEEVHDCVAHIRIVNQLQKILLLSGSILLIILIFLLYSIKITDSLPVTFAKELRADRSILCMGTHSWFHPAFSGHSLAY
jgi:hypothetical protein